MRAKAQEPWQTEESVRAIPETKEGDALCCMRHMAHAHNVTTIGENLARGVSNVVLPLLLNLDVCILFRWSQVVVIEPVANHLCSDAPTEGVSSREVKTTSKIEVEIRFRWVFGSSVSH